MLSLAATLPAVASAAPCADYAYETLRLGPPTVYEGDQIVEAPAAIAAIDQVMNSRGQGIGALLWGEAAGLGAVFYAESIFTPTPAVAAGFSAVREETYANPCGQSVPFSPFQPGRYSFESSIVQGDTTLRGAELIVAPGRDVVELWIRIHRRDIRAVYPIRCASFENTPRSACAVAEASPEEFGEGHKPPAKTLSWERKERRLRIRAGVSWSFVGLSVVSTLPTVILLNQCARYGCFEEYLSVINLPLSATLFVASIIPAAIYTKRLSDHHRARDHRVRVEPRAGGFALRF